MCLFCVHPSMFLSALYNVSVIYVWEGIVYNSVFLLGSVISFTVFKRGGGAKKKSVLVFLPLRYACKTYFIFFIFLFWHGSDSCTWSIFVCLQAQLLSFVSWSCWEYGMVWDKFSDAWKNINPLICFCSWIYTALN